MDEKLWSRSFDGKRVCGERVFPMFFANLPSIQ